MSGFWHVLILHSNPPTHEPKLVQYFLKSEKVTILPQLPYSSDLATCDFFFLFELYLVVITSLDNPLAWSSFSASAVNLYQRPVKHFRNGFKDWHHEYQTAEKILKGCNVYLIWMLFEISYNTHYKSNNPRIHIFILNDTLLIYITVAWIYSIWSKKNEALINHTFTLCASVWIYAYKYMHLFLRRVVLYFNICYPLLTIRCIYDQWNWLYFLKIPNNW